MINVRPLRRYKNQTLAGVPKETFFFANAYMKIPMYNYPYFETSINLISKATHQGSTKLASLLSPFTISKVGSGILLAHTLALKLSMLVANPAFYSDFKPRMILL
jgi:hypothetical protein